MAPLDSQNLLDDFVRCQMAFPAVEAAGAEFTAIGATYLGGNAQRMPVTGVTVERRIGWNENTFDQRMIAQTPEEFPRGIVGALLTAAGPSHARYWDGFGKLGGGAASRPRHENRPRGHPDVQVNDPAGQGTTTGTDHIRGAQDGVRSIRASRDCFAGRARAASPRLRSRDDPRDPGRGGQRAESQAAADVLKYAAMTCGWPGRPRTASPWRPARSRSRSHGSQLPGIDGMEALRRLRGAADSDIPVVAVTAQAMKQDPERALKASFNG